MYGTIGRFHVKEGMEGLFIEALRSVGNLNLPGSVAAYGYRADESMQVYYIAVVFTSKEAYFAHAKHPEVAAIDDHLMTLLEREPEWYDGEVVYAMR